MSTKDLVLDTIKRMPNTATWEDIEERIRFLAAIEKGRKEIREGKVVPHQEVRNRLHSWISS
jgi:predicted transcriptional regulator